MTPRTLIILTSAAALSVPMFLAGCTPRLAIEGGDKPIKIDMTVTLKVDRELDQFFAFEKKYEQPTTQPTTTPTTSPTS